MKVAQYILGFLLAIALTSTVVLFGLNHFIDADYFYKTADKSGLNQAVSDVITERLIEIDKTNSGSSSQSIDQALSSVIAKQYLESKNHEITEQLESVLRGKKDAIRVDFSDLADISQASGFDVTSVDIAPLELTPPKTITQKTDFFLQRIQFFFFMSFTATAFLFAANVVIAVRTGRHLTILLALLLSATSIGAIGFIVGRLPIGPGTDFGLPEGLSPLQLPLQNFVIFTKDGIERWLQLAAGSLFLATCILGAIEYGILQRYSPRDSRNI